MKRIILAALVGVLVSGAAWGKNRTHTGSYWYEECLNPEVSHQLNCMTYVLGVSQGVIIMRRITKFKTGEENIAGICFPKNVNNRQIRDIYFEYLKNNPKTRHKNAGWLFILSMKDAFPCN